MSARRHFLKNISSACRHFLRNIVDKELTSINEEQLYSDVSELIEVTRQRALHEINRAGILLYWHIGRRINHDILKNNRAEYGSSVVKKLADKLQIKFGKGFGLRVIQ